MALGKISWIVNTSASCEIPQLNTKCCSQYFLLDNQGFSLQTSAPHGNLSASHRKFAHHAFCWSFQTYYQCISYIELHCSSYYAPNHQVLNFALKNNNVSILFSWLKKSIPQWTPPRNVAHLPEYIFWLHPWWYTFMLINVVDRAISAQLQKRASQKLDSSGTGHLWSVPWLHFLPEASFGLRVLSLPVSVCVCVRARASTLSLSAR